MSTGIVYVMLIFCVYFDLGVRVLIHCVCCACRLGVYCIHACVIVQVCKLVAGLMVGMLPLCPRCGGGPMSAQRWKSCANIGPKTPQCLAFFCWDCCVAVNKPACVSIQCRFSVGPTLTRHRFSE